MSERLPTQERVGVVVLYALFVILVLWAVSGLVAVAMSSIWGGMPTQVIFAPDIVTGVIFGLVAGRLLGGTRWSAYLTRVVVWGAVAFAAAVVLLSAASRAEFSAQLWANAGGIAAPVGFAAGWLRVVLMGSRGGSDSTALYPSQRISRP